MFLVCANHDDDFVVGSLWANKAEAEHSVIMSFKDINVMGDQLVKIEYQGNTVYASRFKPVPVEDEYEYVDNDGNPINADGSEKVEGVPVEDIPYVYNDTVWIVRPVNIGQPIDLSASEHYLLATGRGHPFETDENLVVITTA